MTHPTTLTDHFRHITGRFMTGLGTLLYKAGIHPDAITIFGLLLVAVAAVFIARGEFIIGGLILLIGLPLDAVDGAVARAMQRSSRFGEMLDSSLDRYADGLIFAALSYHFAVEDRFTLMLLALAALLGSFMVSYIRARADGVHVSVKVGIFTRMERVAVILVVLLIPSDAVMQIGLWLLAVGTNFTSLQRLWFVYKALNAREKERE